MRTMGTQKAHTHTIDYIDMLQCYRRRFTRRTKRTVEACAHFVSHLYFRDYFATPVLS